MDRGCPGHELIGARRVKVFSKKLGLSKKAELYLEIMIRYHGLTNDIVTLIIHNKKKDEYLDIFSDTVGDVYFELVVLMYADILGSDLEDSDKKEFDLRSNILRWMIKRLINIRMSVLE